MDSYFGLALQIAVDLGQVSQERIDVSTTGTSWTSYITLAPINKDLATRILAAWYLLGQDSPDYPAVNFNAWIRFLGRDVDVQDGHGR